MKLLLQKLNEFQYLMIDKFVQRIPKHFDDNTNVCDDNNWIDNEIKCLPRLNINQLEEHLVKEFCEYFQLNYDSISKFISLHIIEGDSHNDYKECPDIANLAFLIWCVKRNNGE